MLKPYLIALLSALFVSLIVTPFSIFLANRFGVLDKIDFRKVHSTVKPRWGGIGIISGFFMGLLVLWMFVPSFHTLLEYSHGVMRNGKVAFTLNLGTQLAGILFGVVVLFVLGLIDDRHSVKPGIKFLIQIIAAFVSMIYGVRIYGLSIPGFEAYAHFPVFISMVVTVLWLVGMANAVNLVDGLDGLAGGIVAIISFAFLAVALVQPQGHTLLYERQMQMGGVIAAALLGGTLGFLVYNFYPARVFMGDSGSLSLGFLVGCVAVIGTFKTTILAVLFVPFILAVVPVVDMIVAFGRRLIKKKSPFTADRGHFHHRLLDRGWTQREIVLCVYVITLVMGFISLTVVGMKR